MIRVATAREDQCRLSFQAVLQRFAAACVEASPAARSLERRFSYAEALCRLRKDQADQADQAPAQVAVISSSLLIWRLAAAGRGSDASTVHVLSLSKDPRQSSRVEETK